MAETNDFIALTVDVVSAFVGQTSMRAEDVPSFIAATYAALPALDASPGDITEPVAVSLGGTEGLVPRPAAMKHLSVAPARTMDLGISDNLVRVSIALSTSTT